MWVIFKNEEHFIFRSIARMIHVSYPGNENL